MRSQRTALRPAVPIRSYAPSDSSVCADTSVRTASSAFIEKFDKTKPDTPFIRYEVGVRYSNGDEIRRQFKGKATAITFLRGMR
jgi:hypothetical protein